MNHRTHTLRDSPSPGKGLLSASEVKCPSRCDQDHAKGLQGPFPKWNTLSLVPGETAQCVLLRVGSTEALKLCLRGSSGSQAEPGATAEFQTHWSSHANAACGVNCPGASLSGKSLALVPRVLF